MFHYVHTSSELLGTNTIEFLDNYVDSYLYSLIYALQSSNFGLDSLHKLVDNLDPSKDDIKSYSQRVRDKYNKQLFIDSGGYSIIVGDVSPRDLGKFIECYHEFLHKYPHLFDKIFSLDIPVFLKHTEYNTVKFIKEQNMKSVNLSKQILTQNNLFDKFIFVWQFTTPNKYNVWRSVYEKVLADTNVQHFGIGGMVGLRGRTGIRFSPFIAMEYKLLKLIYDKNYSKESYIHNLGVYGLHDRFLMAFFHRLFNEYYLKDKNSSVVVSYDTINYFTSGIFNVRKPTCVIKEQDGIMYKCNVLDLDDRNKLRYLIHNEELFENIIKDIDNLIDGNKLKDTRLFCLLNVVSNLEIDKLFDDVVRNFDIVKLFTSCNNFHEFKNKFSPIYDHLSNIYPFAFANRKYNTMLNFQFVYNFHHWWLKDKSDSKLEQMCEKFIKNYIKIPSKFDLAP